MYSYQQGYENIIKGSVNYSSEDRVLFGKIEGIQELMSYEGGSQYQLEKAFKETVEEYINICTEQAKP